MRTPARMALQPTIWQVAAADRVDVLETMLRHGASATATDATGRTPMHWAAGGSALRALALLHAQGADVLARDGSGQLPAHVALAARKPDALRMLLSFGHAMDQIGAADNHGKRVVDLLGDAGDPCSAMLADCEVITTSMKLVEVIQLVAQLTQRLREQQQRQQQQQSGDACILFDEATIAQATDNFNEARRVGRGGFGVVYSGQLFGTPVAVKVIHFESDNDGSGGGAAGADAETTREIEEQQYATEVSSLSRFRHRNIVSLLGASKPSAGRKFLVYDFMAGGNVSDRLSPSSRWPALTALQRVSIARDAARGLLYLHCGAREPLIHLDFKSANVLLDEHLTAKVADFGLVQLAPGLRLGASMAARFLCGTPGYVCPEYVATRAVTDRTDVHGLGIMLLELATGRSAVLQVNPVQLLRDLLAACGDEYRARRTALDPRCAWQSSPTRLSMADQLLALGLACSTPRVADRPQLALVVPTLSSMCTTLQDACGTGPGTAPHPNRPEPLATVRECVVCLAAEPDIMILPCRHAVLCQPCAEGLLRQHEPCPVCRQPFNRVYRGRYSSTYVAQPAVARS